MTTPSSISDEFGATFESSPSWHNSRFDHSGLLACLAAQPVRECQPADIPLTESDFAFTLAGPEVKQRIVVALVAMSKKATSKPMRQILQLLAQYKVFDIIVFNDNVIMNVPVEQWPPCDALIAFHSGKFPLDKAIAYARLHKPVMINDLEMEVSSCYYTAISH